MLKNIMISVSTLFLFCSLTACGQSESDKLAEVQIKEMERSKKIKEYYACIEANKKYGQDKIKEMCNDLKPSE